MNGCSVILCVSRQAPFNRHMLDTLKSCAIRCCHDCHAPRTSALQPCTWLLVDIHAACAEQRLLPFSAHACVLYPTLQHCRVHCHSTGSSSEFSDALQHFQQACCITTSRMHAIITGSSQLTRLCVLACRLRTTTPSRTSCSTWCCTCRWRWRPSPRLCRTFSRRSLGACPSAYPTPWTASASSRGRPQTSLPLSS